MKQNFNMIFVLNEIIDLQSMDSEKRNNKIILKNKLKDQIIFNDENRFT